MTLSTEPGGFAEAPGGALVHFIDLDLHAGALHTEVNDPVVLIHASGATGTTGHARSAGSHTVAEWSPVDVRGGGGNVQAPQKVNPLLADALGIPEELVPKR